MAVKQQPKLTIKQRVTYGAGATLTAMALGTAILADMEGRSLSAYLDIVGVPTICDGITGKGADGKPIQLGQTATNEECDGLTGKRLKIAMDVVDNRVEIPLSPYQRAGLASFVYNVGQGAFERSNLLKDLNAGRVLQACDRLTIQWTMIKTTKGSISDKRAIDKNGKVTSTGKIDGYKDCSIKDNKCGGIYRRRVKERELCLHVDDKKQDTLDELILVR